MARLQGLSGLAGYQNQIDANSQATPEERSGNIADPRHAERGEQARPYSWESQMTPGGSHGPYGPENQLLGDEWWFFQPAGVMTQDPDFDRTPARRAAPWPKGIASGRVPGEGPDDIVNQLTQSRQIHATDMGGSGKYLHAIPAQNDEWEEIWAVDTGSTDVQQNSRQSMSAGFMWGTRDVVQSFARQNEYGFNAAHKHRRYATGAIPGNTYWMRPGGRPLAKTLPGPARPAIGPDSPFHGDDLGQAFGIGGAILLDLPSEYTAPPQPNLATPIVGTPSMDVPVVEWY